MKITVGLMSMVFCCQAQFYIFEKVKNELRLAAHDEVHLRTEIVVPKQSIGRIIGKGGQNVSICRSICVSLHAAKFAFMSFTQTVTGERQNLTSLIRNCHYLVASTTAYVQTPILQNLYFIGYNILATSAMNV